MHNPTVSMNTPRTQQAWRSILIVLLALLCSIAGTSCGSMNMRDDRAHPPKGFFSRIFGRDHTQKVVRPAVPVRPTVRSIRAEVVSESADIAHKYGSAEDPEVVERRRSAVMQAFEDLVAERKSAEATVASVRATRTRSAVSDEAICESLLPDMDTIPDPEIQPDSTPASVDPGKEEVRPAQLVRSAVQPTVPAEQEKPEAKKVNDTDNSPKQGEETVNTTEPKSGEVVPTPTMPEASGSVDDAFKPPVPLMTLEKGVGEDGLVRLPDGDYLVQFKVVLVGYPKFEAVRYIASLYIGAISEGADQIWVGYGSFETPQTPRFTLLGMRQRGSNLEEDMGGAELKYFDTAGLAPEVAKPLDSLLVAYDLFGKTSPEETVHRVVVKVRAGTTDLVVVPQYAVPGTSLEDNTRNSAMRAFNMSLRTPGEVKVLSWGQEEFENAPPATDRQSTTTAQFPIKAVAASEEVSRGEISGPQMTSSTSEDSKWVWPLLAILFIGMLVVGLFVLWRSKSDTGAQQPFISEECEPQQPTDRPVLVALEVQGREPPVEPRLSPTPSAPPIERQPRLGGATGAGGTKSDPSVLSDPSVSDASSLDPPPQTDPSKVGGGG